MQGFMIILKPIIEILFGFAAGAITASGLFALISSIGLINRFAAVTKTTEKINLYEDMIVIGAAVGNVISIFNFSFRVPGAIEMLFAILYGAIAGIFIGTFSVCLAETIKSLPIFVRRVRIGTGLGWVILSVALGKGVGHLLYYFVLYK